MRLIVMKILLVWWVVLKDTRGIHVLANVNDTWCKPSQCLDHKNCVCKNKLVGRLTEECTGVIN